MYLYRILCFFIVFDKNCGGEIRKSEQSLSICYILFEEYVIFNKKLFFNISISNYSHTNTKPI